MSKQLHRKRRSAARAFVIAWLLPFLAALLGLLSAAAQAQVPAAPAAVASPAAPVDQRVAAARRSLQDAGLRAGLDAGSDFLVTRSEVDQLAMAHTRFQQRLNGVPVWGAELITHSGPDGALRATTNAVLTVPRIGTAPRLNAAQALAQVDRDLMRKGAWFRNPQAELVIYHVRTGRTAAPVWRLAWHLLVSTRNAQDGLRDMRYFVDAQNGAVLDKWSELQHAHAPASAARSIFSGLVTINANSVPGGYELRDLQRGVAGRYGNNVVLRYAGPGAATIFTDGGNTWGDGNNYIPGSASSGSDDTAQSAGVDVAYATAVTWDMYANVLGRKGFDGTGKSVYSTVHMYYGAPYNTGANASWSMACECMDFGYGDSATGLRNVVDLDIVGHELTHGLIQKTAGLVYSSEPGALNEGIADIFGLAVKSYARGGGHARAAGAIAAGEPWTIGENLGDPRFTRYYIRPSAERGSFDAWDSSFIDQTDEHDVHRISGPVRRAFYFMSNGAAASGDGYSPHLGHATAGIGFDRALRIWYRALSFYMTRMTDFGGARQGLISAARDLYGAGSPEEAAVWNAFAGIHVGPAWGQALCGQLLSSRVLGSGEGVSSCNGKYALRMQGDGNLVLYGGAGAVGFSSGSYGNAHAYAVMQADGNLVIYKANGFVPLWHAGTHGSPGAAMDIGDDGNLVVYAANRVPLWYLRAPPAAAGTVASSRNNTRYAAADAVAPGTTGITGSAAWNSTSALEQPAYFRFRIPAGKTIDWDFVGGNLLSSAWLLEVLGSGERALASTSTASRGQLSFANPGNVALEVVLRIGRQNYASIPDMTDQRFSIAVSYR